VRLTVVPDHEALSQQAADLVRAAARQRAGRDARREVYARDLEPRATVECEVGRVERRDHVILRALFPKAAPHQLTPEAATALLRCHDDARIPDHRYALAGDELALGQHDQAPENAVLVREDAQLFESGDPPPVGHRLDRQPEGGRHQLREWPLFVWPGTVEAERVVHGDSRTSRSCGCRGHPSNAWLKLPRAAP